MARKRVAGSIGKGSGWLNSYSNTFTLILTFFVLLCSMSSIDAKRFNMLVSAFAGGGKSSFMTVRSGTVDGQDMAKAATQSPAAATMPEDDLEKAFIKLRQYVGDMRLSDSVTVSNGDNYVFIQFMNNMLFEEGSAVLKPGAREILQSIGNDIKQVQEQCSLISIHGHMAAIPENPVYAVSDRTLSADRANVVLAVFEDIAGIDSNKLFAVGWGKTRPLAPGSNNTEEGRAKNRRLEILISTENLLAEQLDNVYAKLVK